MTKHEVLRLPCPCQSRVRYSAELENTAYCKEMVYELQRAYHLNPAILHTACSWPQGVCLIQCSLDNAVKQCSQNIVREARGVDM